MVQMIKGDRQKKIFLLSLVFVLQVIIFAPHAGTGFVTDDFIWLDNIVIDGEVDYLRPLTITTGFFRPLVSWTFGLQYELHGMNSRPYGWFNLFLHLVNIFLVYLLLSSVELCRPYAFWAAALFGFNTKGATMAVGWISGRTTLLFACFTLLSLYLYLNVRQQHRQKKWSTKGIFLYFLVGIVYFAALLSKETAVAVPFFVFLASLIHQKEKNNGTGSRTFLSSVQRAFLNTVVFLVPLILYFFLRVSSNAIVIFNAPEYYRFTLAPLVILKNLVEYVLRSGMLDFIIIACLLIMLPFTRGKTKAVKDIPRLPLIAGTGWFLCFLLPTLFIPTRSDIYIYFPQVGVHLAALPIIFYLWEATDSSKRKKLKQGIALLLVGISILTYIASFVFIASQNGEKGKKSTAFIQQLIQFTRQIKPGAHTFVIDMEPGQAFSPTRTVSYGFAAILHLYYPHCCLTGTIIPPDNVTKIKCDENMFNFFFWGNGHLTGPLNCNQLKTVICFISPDSSILSSVEEEPKKPRRKRLYRLKKRKMRLKQQNIEKNKMDKNINQ
ncbi:MAG: hypothetical protein PVH61_07395 [Candidatus Aminicenantes bacterium]|jgi:hypothetical protein